MFVNHVLEHKQHMTLGMVAFVPKQSIRLSSCDLFIGHCLVIVNWILFIKNTVTLMIFALYTSQEFWYI